ncbi:peptidoglycan DD-metalloendopeptidase family protein [Methylomarinum sp. Ch1-1]|uniref:Peptidoglycan DD-metalloendopeptidase family protein n=1 Tax=Methylomarinum roseum TaxID=3067653 RepID=A0AAU7NUH7_9GAMM|nr:peptidoglycan DD-metalloendopeptidase family protein [Methylomarinum sp. Ch1-1]MDP4519302.1 peptidoglycan DD-metalloendopeptidase family protein [Methylomarinum sp. Ch1-1]
MKNKIFKSLLFGGSTIVAASACYALISPSSDNNSESLTEVSVVAEPATLKIDSPIVADAASDDALEAIEDTGDKFKEIIHTVKNGESLSTIFSDLDLSKTDLHKIIHANDTGKLFASLNPGKDLVAKVNSDGQLEELLYHKNSIETLFASRHDDDFKVEKLSKQIDKQVTSAQATIHSSLFLDGKNAGLSDKLIMELANIFAWDIDFALNLRDGDQFTVVYEKLFVDGQEFDSGEIISAEFVNQGDVYTAVRFEDPKGNADYYTPDGNSMRKAFLRTPVDFARISSPFNLKRKHPVLNRIRAHKGVDYAARTGTPIKSTGDGKIIYRGRKGGYGNVVIVQHGQTYTTLYAHLSKFRKGQRTGNRIKQGQVIGYVGMSGLATGPHLHYEFRVNGVHRNPLTVKLPKANPINKSLLAEFKAQTAPLLAQLDKAKASTLLAQNQQ